MRLLHTSDWHVGKRIKGIPRIEEHRHVLAEVAGIAAEEAVDLVLVAGDLFESAAPPPEAQSVVWDALLALRATGAQVIVVAGNHDNPHQLEAIRPVLAGLGIIVLGHACRPTTVAWSRSPPAAASERGWSCCRSARSATWYVPPSSWPATAPATPAPTPSGCTTSSPASPPASPPTPSTWWSPTARCGGASFGGGEREAQTIFDYWVSATAFPASAHYVALGHLHRTQQLPGSCPVWYSGSPIQVDFGEENDDKHVLVVDVTASTPARVRPVKLTSGRRLRTVRGTLDELARLSGSTGDDLLRVVVAEPTRARLAEEVRALLPLAVEVRVEGSVAQRAADGAGAGGPSARSPHELFAAFLAERGVADERVTRLFARLLDEETADRVEAS